MRIEEVGERHIIFPLSFLLWRVGSKYHNSFFHKCVVVHMVENMRNGVYMYNGVSSRPSHPLDNHLNAHSTN